MSERELSPEGYDQAAGVMRPIAGLLASHPWLRAAYDQQCSAVFTLVRALEEARTERELWRRAQIREEEARKAALARLREAVDEAVSVARDWHNEGLRRVAPADQDEAWKLYFENAPELAKTRQALAEAGGAREEGAP